ncbi:hypothetical protein KQI63_00430 [bacterium]|nr:hypothetical protein [bacterium]
MTYFGPLLKKVAYGIWVFVALFSTFYDLVYIADSGDLFSLAGWSVILPITLLVVPFKVMAETGYWFPMIFTYGGIVIGVIVYTIGRMMLAEDLQTGRVEPEE